MKIKALQTCHGSLDGEKVIQFAEGHEYETVGTRGERCAQAYIRRGMAVEVTEIIEVIEAAPSAVTPPAKPTKKPKKAKRWTE